MTSPKRPLTPILAELPKADRRPTVVRPHGLCGGIFAGWGPKL